MKGACTGYGSYLSLDVPIGKYMYLIFGYRNLSQDYDNVEEVNRQLEKMGFNIGVRIVEDFLARTNSGKCTDLR